MTAGVTYIHMVTVVCGAAMLNSIHNIELLCRKIVVSAIFFSVKVENIGDFVFWRLLRF